MGGEGHLDLLGEHLLAAGVDAHRIATQELDRAVRGKSGAVAGHGVAFAVDDREGSRGLVGIAEVAERHPAGLGQPPDLAGTRFERSAQVLAHHPGRRGSDEPGCRILGRPRRGHALAPALRRTQHVDDRQPGDRVEELRLHVGAEYGAAGEEVSHRRDVVRCPGVGTASQLVEQGAGEGVTDDQEAGGPVALDGRPDVGGVEVFGVVLDDDRATGDPAADRVPMRCAVHERRGRERSQRRSFGGRHDLVDRLVVGSVGPTNAQGRHHEVGLAPQHPLGHAGRAAGVAEVEIVAGALAERASLGGRRGERLLVPPGAAAVDVGQQRVARRVRNLQEERERRKVGEHFGQQGSEGRVEDDRLRPAVAQHVGELGCPVAVVDVHRRAHGLVRAEHAFEVLVAVVEVERDVVLGRLPAVRPGERAGAAEPRGSEDRSEVVGAVGDVGPCQPTVPERQALAPGVGNAQRVADVGDVQLHGPPSGRR